MSDSSSGSDPVGAASPPPPSDGQQSMASFLPGGSGGAAAAPRPTQQKNPAAQLTFPDKVPVATKGAVLEFVLPKRRSFHPIKNPNGKISGALYYGVKLDVVLGEGRVCPRERWFACLANSTCRQNKTMLKLTGETSTGATEHLKKIHGILMKKGVEGKKRKLDAENRKNVAFLSQAYKDSPSRYNIIQFVKSFIISQACPFSIGDNPHVRHCLSLLCPNDLEVACLNEKGVKRIIVELYDDTLGKHSRAVLEAVKKAVIKIVYINLDIWQSKVSGEKFIGVRIFYMDHKGILRTYLLAVKLFRPDPSLRKITGVVVMKWARQLLADHGLADENIAGAVTDAGADVSTGVGKAFPREWCFCHMVNRALIEGTGMSTSGSGALINPGCKSLLDGAKTVIEFLNRSTTSKILLENTMETMGNGKGSKSKLSQAVVQRWTSVCKTLMRFLQKWDALLKVYSAKEKVFPLISRKKEFEEVYSIVRALKDFTVYCQTTHEATATGAMQKMIALLGITLEPNKPLPMLSVPTVIVVDGEEGANGGDDDGGGDDDDEPATPTAEKRPHDQLTDVGRHTREALLTALSRRFLPRYGPGLLNRSHLFDRAMLLSPTMLKLMYIDKFAGSAAGEAAGMAPVSDIKARIRDEVVELLTEAVTELRARADKASAAAQPGTGERQSKKSKPSAAATQTQLDLRELGLLDDHNGGGGDEGEQEAQEIDAGEEAKAILQGWLDTKFSIEKMDLSAADYWRIHGHNHPPALRAVAQAVLGCPASAGVIERDFCIADWFMPRKRGSLDPAYLEMCLYLRAQFEYIANDVPALTKAQADAAIPNRLTDQTKLDEVNVLSFEAPEKPEDESEDLDAPWVQPEPESTNDAGQGGVGPG